MFLNAEINHLYGDQGSKEMNNNCVLEKIDLWKHGFLKLLLQYRR